MKVKDNSYVNIQAFMVNELHLSGNELIIFACIHGFSQDGVSWFTGSRAYLAGWCQTSKNTVSNNLAKLCEKGFIEKRMRIENGVTFNDYRVSPNLGGVCKKFDGGVQEICTGGVQEICPHTIDTNTNLNPSNKNKPVRHKYGEYGNVLLSDQEMEKLQAEFPNDWKDRIERLSSYIASSGKKYANHLATIRSWARRDNQNKPKEAEKPTPVEDELTLYMREMGYSV